jgi:hypothetical protein
MNEPTTAQAHASQCPQDIDLWRWPKLQALRATLGQKAKQEKPFRCYSLDDHSMYEHLQKLGLKAL